MKLALPAIILFTLLLRTQAKASTETKTPPQPAANLNQSKETKPTPDQGKQVTPAASKGQLLYENHCLKCHESNIHIRKKDKARNITDVRTWVVKWQTYEKLGWDRSAINAVTDYLIIRYYKFDE